MCLNGPTQQKQEGGPLWNGNDEIQTQKLDDEKVRIYSGYVLWIGQLGGVEQEGEGLMC